LFFLEEIFVEILTLVDQRIIGVDPLGDIGAFDRTETLPALSQRFTQYLLAAVGAIHGKTSCK